MISQEKIQKVAELSQLKLTPEEAQNLTDQLSKALQHFEQIAQVPTEGVEPMVTPTPLELLLREDRVEKLVETEALLENAPSRQGNLFQVPPVVG